MKQMKLKDLMTMTKSFKPILVSNATQVGITFAKVNYGKDTRGYYKSVLGSALSRGTKKRIKFFEIRLYYDPKSNYVPPKMRTMGKDKYIGPEDAPPFTVESTVWLRCNCEYFLYACEVAVGRRGSAPIGKSQGGVSNGAWYKPTGPNPSGVPNVCKHILAAIKKGALVKK